MKTVAIVILNFNGKKNTIKCIESFKEIQDFPNHKTLIVVVDNASNDGSIEAIKSRFPDITLIQNKKNLGYGEGNNVGIRYAIDHGSSYVLIINNDTIVNEALVKELLTVAKADRKIGIVCPKIYFEKEYEFHKDRYKKGELGKVIWYAGGEMDWNNVIGYHRGVDEVDYGQFEKEMETDFASGNCMLIRKEVFDKVGFFDKKYFLYYEDSDFSMRVKKAGFAIRFVPKAMLWHKNAASAGGSGSLLQDYYITRNRLIFGMRYASFRAKAALIKESFALFLKGRKWQRQGVFDFYIGRFEKGSFKI